MMVAMESKITYLTELFNSFSFETQVFLVTIVFFAFIFHLTYTQSTVEKAPAILTTLGILGTFVGIALGLLHFNTADISASVPQLIEGIKTAVWASAVGIFCALTIKLRDIEAFYKRRKPAKKASVEDLIAAMQSLEKALKQKDEATLQEVSLAKADQEQAIHIAAEGTRKSNVQF